MKYTFILKLSLIASQLLMLVGCCPSGCFVLHGEAFRELANPKPNRDYLTHPTNSDQQRSEDWIACGGGESGWYYPSKNEIEAERRPNENITGPIWARLLQKIMNCMKAKGYERTLK